MSIEEKIKNHSIKPSESHTIEELETLCSELCLHKITVAPLEIHK